MIKKGIPFLQGAEKTRFTYMPRIFYMDSKNVQKTRFQACFETKSLYMVIEKLMKTHVEGFWDFVSWPLNKQNNNFMRDPWTF